jgi:hypothetical protein
MNDAAFARAASRWNSGAACTTPRSDMMYVVTGSYMVNEGKSVPEQARKADLDCSSGFSRRLEREAS